MKKQVIVITLLSQCCFYSLALADETVFTGTVDLGARYVDVSGDMSKFNEYRDVDSGVYGGLDLSTLYESGYYFDFSADNVGYDDQSYLLEGGRFNRMKYSLYYDETIHNITEDAKTFYAGAGSAQLTTAATPSDPSEWLSFDYKKERHELGGDIEYNFGENYYLKFGLSNLDTTGTVPFGGEPLATEFPAPADWQETMLDFTAGYRDESLTASLVGQFTDFDNDDEAVSRDTDITSLAPDNEMRRLAGKMVWRPDLYSSIVGLNVSYTQSESDSSLSTIVPQDQTEFSGEVTKTQLDATWGLSLSDDLGLKLLAKYLDRENDSTEITTTDGQENDPYSSERFQTGIEADYYLSRKTQLDARYLFTNKDYEGRSDTDSSDDHEISIRVDSQTQNDIELSAAYAYLTRDGNYSGTSATNRSYDVADQDRHALEFEAGYYPSLDLGFSLDLSWYDADYSDTGTGLTDLEHYDAYLSMNYVIREKTVTTIYGGLEWDKSSNLGDEEETTYNTYALGISIETSCWADRLKLFAGWNYLITDGEAEYSDPSYVDIDDSEDYYRNDVEVKGTYLVDDSWSVTVGYLYEDFNISDDQWTSYILQPISGTTLTGAYSDQDFKGHTTYITAQYRF